VLIWAVVASGATHVVRPDGGGDFPTIQAAVHAAVDGDVVELTNGTFAGTGNRDIDLLGRALTVRSQSGDPAACTAARSARSWAVSSWTMTPCAAADWPVRERCS
jgi:hypothetical protein